MKRILPILIFTLTAFTTLIAQPAYINEFHYDDNGATDTDERIEVAIPNPGNYYNNLYIFLYNGSDKMVYGSAIQYYGSGALADSFSVTGGKLYVYNYTINSESIQNGAPDGIALVADYGLGTEKVLQFLSYEGTFTAIGGPANGMLSTSIVKSESNSTPIGYSLQFNRTTQGWDAPATNTFGALNTNQTTLPLRFISFTAQNRRDVNYLTWQTAEEKNVSHFEIQRSLDARDFRTIGRVDANELRERVNTYSYTDRRPAAGMNYYRIVGVDHDGTTTTSRLATARVGRTGLGVHATVQGQISSPDLTGDALLSVYDTQGRMVFTHAMNGAATIQLPEDIQNGVYLMVLTSGQDVATEKMILQR